MRKKARVEEREKIISGSQPECISQQTESENGREIYRYYALKGRDRKRCESKMERES